MSHDITHPQGFSLTNKFGIPRPKIFSGILNIFFPFLMLVCKSKMQSCRVLFWTENGTKSMGHPHAFFKSLVGKSWYKQTGPAQIDPIHPPPSFSHHQAITRIITNRQYKGGVRCRFSCKVKKELSKAPLCIEVIFSQNAATQTQT